MKGDPNVSSRVVVRWPGHPNDGDEGYVVNIKRATKRYVRRAFVMLDSGEGVYVPSLYLRERRDE